MPPSEEGALQEGVGAALPVPEAKSADADHDPDCETPQVKTRPVPPAPSDKEREEHNCSGHAVYRPWCPPCVGGRGRSEKHETVNAESRDLPTVGSDYTYLAEKQQDVIDEKASPILVSTCNKSGWIKSDVLPTKSGQNKHCVMMLVNLYILLGFARFISKSDQEPAILDLRRRAISYSKSEHGMEIVPEESPTYESPSNGFVEGACGRVKALVRTLKLAAEILHNTTIPKDHPMLTWAVSFAGAALSRFAKGPDGFTAWYRLKQKPYRKALPMWSEKVLYLPAGKRKSKITDKWLPGVFLGVIDRSDELQMGTPDGVVKARSYKRLSLADRSDSKFFLNCVGVPWCPVPTQPSLEEIPITTHIAAPLQVPRSELPPPPPTEPEADAKARRVYIRADVELKNPLIGYTPNCGGCRAAQLGTTPVGHTPECRKRIEDILEKTETGQKRMQKAWEKAIAIEEDKAKKRLTAPVRAAPQKKWQKVSEGVYEPLPDNEPGTSSASGNTAPLDATPAPPTANEDVEIADESLRPPWTGDEPLRPPTVTEAGPNSSKRSAEDLADEDMRPHKQTTLESIMLEINALTHMCGECQDPVDVAEVFSPGRFTSRASAFALRPGFALDLRTGWDFDRKEHRDAAFELQKRLKPWFVIGSPKCSFASTLQRLNPDSPQWRALLRQGLQHLVFVCEMYKRQHSAGRRFLHEHPEHAASWGLWMIREVLALPGVEKTLGDQCPFGQWGIDALGEALCQKGTGWMTNSKPVALRVGVRCSNRTEPDKSKHHRHVLLMGGRASAMETYPPMLVSEILKGIREDMVEANILGALEVGLHVDDPEPIVTHADWYHHVVDCYTGAPLPPELVAKGRKDEMHFMRDLKVYRYDQIQACIDSTGKPPVPVGWVEHNKGDDNTPIVRCRLVINETKRRSSIEVDDIAAVFSATPPYESFRMLISFTMTPELPEDEDDILMFIDISRAHPHAEIDRDVWCELPPEDPRYGEPGLCAKLQKTHYGLRDAGRNFELKVGFLMKLLEFSQGLMSPCLFYNAMRRIKAFVHGDNFVLGGSRVHLNWFAAELGKHLIVVIEGVLGPRPDLGDKTEVNCLNRIVRWVNETPTTPRAIEIEADPRHCDLILKDLNLHQKNAKTVTTPSVKPKDGFVGDPVAKDDVRAFRSTCMRMNYMAEDRPDVKYVGKEIARFMSEPTNVAQDMMKRAGRYLKLRPRLVQCFEKQSFASVLDGLGDTNHAGCLRTRRSTTCSVMKYGKHTVKFSVTTQVPIGTSSGESEWYGTTKTVSLLMGGVSMAKDLGRDLFPIAHTDSTASRGIGSRRGVGRVRHLETSTLWVQKYVTDKRLKLVKRLGTENEADLGTKDQDAATIVKHLTALGYQYREGRAGASKTLIET